MRVLVAGLTSHIGSSLESNLIALGDEVVGFGSNYDVTKKHDISSYHELLVSQGKEDIDALVYCVGKHYMDWVENIDDNEMMKLFNINVMGLLRCLQVFTTVKKLVVVSSMAADHPMRCSTAYCSSKSALNMMTACISKELPYNLEAVITVNPSIISGGSMSEYVDSSVMNLRGWTDEQMKEKEMDTVGPRLEVDDVAKAIVNGLYSGNNGEVINMKGDNVTTNQL